jgi:hypothetical protein
MTASNSNSSLLLSALAFGGTFYLFYRLDLQRQQRKARRPAVASKEALTTWEGEGGAVPTPQFSTPADTAPAPGVTA